MNIEEAREGIGRRVVYEPPGAPPERGMITEVRPAFEHPGYVFVRYDGDRVAKATAAEMLRFDPDDLDEAPPRRPGESVYEWTGRVLGERRDV